MAKAPGLLAHGHVGCGCRRHPRYEPTSIFEIVPADCTRATYRKKRRLRHVAVFWVAHGPVDTCPSEMGVPEVKYNSSRAVINGLSADGVGDHDSN